MITSAKNYTNKTKQNKQTKYDQDKMLNRKASCRTIRKV